MYSARPEEQRERSFSAIFAMQGAYCRSSRDMSSRPTKQQPQLQSRRKLLLWAKYPWTTESVADPVGAGFVDSLARPGGNATGFILFEYGISCKWLELLKEAVPGVASVAVLREHTPAGVGQFAAIQALAPSLAIEVRPINLKDAAEIERDIETFAHVPNAGLIVASSTTALVNRNLIIDLVMRNKLPAVYAQREFVVAGGLMSYAADFNVQFRNAAGYVDRILKGAKPADLPVQAPTKYELVINLKTANVLGLAIPQLLIRADEVIE
jgi:putative tryptophan/tyrosine transport system substrate-binding protein